MTPDQVIELAKQAGLTPPYLCGGTRAIQDFAELIIEECAKKCDDYAMEANASSEETLYSELYYNAGKCLAKEIRGMKS